MTRSQNLYNMVAKELSVSQIYSIETKKYSNSYHSTMHRLDHWEFIYLFSGSLCVIEGSKEIKINPNEIYFYKPLERHGYYSIGNGTTTVISCCFSCHDSKMSTFYNFHTSLSDIEKKYLYKMISNTTPMIFSDELPDDSNNLNNKPFSSKNMQTIHGELNFLLACLLESGKSPNPINQSHANTTVNNSSEMNLTITDEIISYINKNVYNHISLEDISNELNYSVSWIKTNFKKNVGVGIIEYCNKIKIDKAKQLLESNIKISKVAEMLDFYDQSYFNRLFKNFTGLTPSEYKKSFLRD